MGSPFHHRARRRRLPRSAAGDLRGTHHGLRFPAAVAPRPPAPPPPPPPPPRPAATPAARPLTQDEQFQRKSLAELNTEQPLRDAFFDYDQNESRDDARLALQQDAKWLAKWPRTTISVDGMQSAAGTAPY